MFSSFRPGTLSLSLWHTHTYSWAHLKSWLSFQQVQLVTTKYKQTTTRLCTLYVQAIATLARVKDRRWGELTKAIAFEPTISAIILSFCHKPEGWGCWKIGQGSSFLTLQGRVLARVHYGGGQHYKQCSARLQTLNTFQALYCTTLLQGLQYLVVPCLRVCAIIDIGSGYSCLLEQSIHIKKNLV